MKIHQEINTKTKAPWLLAFNHDDIPTVYLEVGENYTVEGRMRLNGTFGAYILWETGCLSASSDHSISDALVALEIDLAIFTNNKDASAPRWQKPFPAPAFSRGQG